MHIRTALPDDLPKIQALYQKAAGSPGYALSNDDMTLPFIERLIQPALADGLVLLVIHPEDEHQCIGEIHVSRDPRSFCRHVMTGLHLVVDPQFQRKKIGRTLLTILLEEIALNHPHIGKVDLMLNENNTRALTLFQSMGFTVEGRMEMKVLNQDRMYEAEIPMGWQNPNYEL